MTFENGAIYSIGWEDGASFFFWRDGSVWNQAFCCEPVRVPDGVRLIAWDLWEVQIVYRRDSDDGPRSTIRKSGRRAGWGASAMPRACASGSTCRPTGPRSCSRAASARVRTSCSPTGSASRLPELLG